MVRAADEEAAATRAQQAADAAGYVVSKGEEEGEGEAVGLGHLEHCLTHIAGFSSDLATLGAVASSQQEQEQPPDIRQLRISTASAPQPQDHGLAHGPAAPPAPSGGLPCVTPLTAIRVRAGTVDGELNGPDKAHVK